LVTLQDKDKMVQHTDTSPSCAACAELELRQEPEEHHCRQGRFDKKKPRWFAPVGIAKPNKTVAQAQNDCPFYKPKSGQAAGTYRNVLQE
jgi:hypothetical protein